MEGRGGARKRPPFNHERFEKGKAMNFRRMQVCLPLLLCLVLCPLFAFAAGDFAYLLPARGEVSEGEGLEVDYYPQKNEIILVKLLDASGGEIRHWRLNAGGARPRRFVWDGKGGKKPAEEGKYTLTFALKNSVAEAERVSFAVVKAAEKEKIAVTAPEKWLPESEKDFPAALPDSLVTADADKRVPLRAKPEKNAEKTGEIWGKTQGLKVLAVEGDWARAGAYRLSDGEYVEGHIELKKLKTVAPGGAFALVVDKKTQTLYLYENGQKLAEMPVSTGKATKNKPNWETPAGAYLLGDRERDAKDQRMPIRFGAGCLYAAQDTGVLGQKSTRGGIAVPPVSEKNPYGMEWMWAHLPRYTKLLILDDAAERRAAAAAAKTPQKGGTPAAPAATRNPAYVAKGSTDIRFSFGGDCVLGSDVGEHALPDSIDSAIKEKGLGWLFDGILPVFSSDDLTLVNLETVLQKDAAGFKKRQHNFRGLPEYAHALTLGSVEAVNVANNHHIDFTASGRKSTIAALEKEGTRYSGYGHLDVYEKNGVRVGFGGIRETTYRGKPEQVDKDIAALKGMGCHYIIYSMHFGKEYAREHNALQTKMARHAVDAGADLVIGTHTHVVQGLEKYNGGLIFYSLGNLVFGGNRHLTEFDALLFQADVHFENGEWQRLEVRLLPVLTTGARPLNDFRPILAGGDDKTTVMQKIQHDTPFQVTETMIFNGKQDLIGN